MEQENKLEQTEVKADKNITKDQYAAENAALKEQVAALLAEKEAQKMTSATENAASEKVYDPDERVELLVPPGRTNDDHNLVIGINGKLYVLPRGEVSMVPRAVKDEYDRAVKAQARLDKRIDEIHAAQAQPK